MFRMAGILYFITPLVYLYPSFFSKGVFSPEAKFTAIPFYTLFVAVVGFLNFLACLPYYFYPEKMRKYTVLGGAIGVSLMYVICMSASSKTLIFAEGNYILAPIASIPAFLLRSVIVRALKESKSYTYVIVAMIISMLSLIPILILVSEEVYVPTCG